MIEPGVVKEVELLLEEADHALVDATNAQAWIRRSEKEQLARRLIARAVALLRPAA